MNKFRKIIAVISAILMLLPVFSLMIIAEEQSNIPTIFLDGIGSSDTVNGEGDVVFPPQAGNILDAVKDAILPLMGSLVTGDYTSCEDDLSVAVQKMFDEIAMDENGVSATDADTAYVRPTPEEIRETVAKTEHNDKYDYIWYSYDWRYDMQTLAGDFHDFIEYVLDATGARKVNVIAFSMGTAVLMTYLHDYDYQYINNFVLLGGAFNGVNSCGDSFSGNITFSGTAFAHFFTGLTGDNFGGKLLDALLVALYEMGLFNGVADLGTKIVDQTMDYLYENGLALTFGRMPGLWALMAPESYDPAKEKLLEGSGVSDEFIAKIDYYHDEIQANNETILNGALAKGVNWAIVGKYGYTIPPVTGEPNELGDGVIEGRFESCGATIALAGETLGDDYVQAVDDGHNHISADNIVDASTCAFPENTWMIKNSWHDDNFTAILGLIDWLLAHEDAQATVWEDNKYPQFLIYTKTSETLEPLTEENDVSGYAEVSEEPPGVLGFFRSILNLIFRIFNTIKTAVSAAT
ncbi:MAG: alpha/beta fold hydrolase [Clostridia bacterium]|nr:alpha/beta fold hydrolase [Clostridia bacterium]